MSNGTFHQTSIEFDPRIIYEALGSKIIESDSIAIAEQIKNARDAGAEDICIDFSNIHNDIVEISDNGNGMTIGEIKENWFFVASSKKQNSYDQLGGKGIGRFSLFRLANIIEIETINNGNKYNFEINKQDLMLKSSLSDVNMKIFERATKEPNGTKIKLSSLNNINLKEIEKELQNLSYPFNQSSFDIRYPNSFIMTKYEKPNSTIKHAPFYAEIEFSGNTITAYSFKCNYKGASIYENTDKSKVQKMISDALPIDIGKTKVYIYNFYFDPMHRNVTKKTENFIKNNFLAAYQGISVYRNHYKIYGHGEEDWLKLAEKRLKRSADNIDNKLTFGYIILDPINSLGLEEKTNREGFLRNDYSLYFRKTINAIVTQFGQDRKRSISLIKEYNAANGSLGPVEGTAGTETGVTPVAGNIDTETDVTPVAGNIGTETDVTPVASNVGTETDVTPVAGNVGTETDNVTPNGGNNGVETIIVSPVDGSKGIETVDALPVAGGAETESEKSMPIKYKFNKRIGSFDQELLNKIQSDKVRDLMNEILTIDTKMYPLATSYLMRSLVEVSMNEYIRVHFNKINQDFKDYLVDENNNIKKRFKNKKTGEYVFSEITIKRKIGDFKKFLSSTTSFDFRSLNHLDDLADFIDDINLTM
ncbi:ATP-binding protein, partial [Peribacillus frigoritolerans]|uniref:ATP-binding protein n=1 Tax=Peribacillus frigoritolerans TaxID=450367 RepID=UPI00381122C4